MRSWICEGRSLEKRQQLLLNLSKGISDVLDKPENELVLSLNEVISATTMEFRLIPPQPGGEPEWFEKKGGAQGRRRHRAVTTCQASPGLVG